MTFLSSQNNLKEDSLRASIKKINAFSLQVTTLNFVPFSKGKTLKLDEVNNKEFGQFFNENVTIGDITTFTILSTVGYSTKIAFEKATKFNYSFNYGIGFLYSKSIIKYKSILHRPPNPYNPNGIHFEGNGISQQEEYSIIFNFGLNTNLHRRLWLTNEINLNTTLFIKTIVDETNTLNGSNKYIKSKKINEALDFFYFNSKGLMTYTVNTQHVLFYELIKKKLYIGAGLNYFFNSKYQSYLISQISLKYKLCKN